MKINRVEQHIIKNKSPTWKIIDDLSFKSKNLYNYANYLIRQEFINNKRWIGYYELFELVKNSDCYKDMGSNVGQQTLKLLDKNWKSFFVSIKDWSKNPSKYLGKPKLPKYKDKNGRSFVGIDNIKFSIVDEYIRFSWKPLKSLNNMFKTNIKDKVIQLRFIPKGSNYIMEIVYEINIPEPNKDNNINIIGIDLGIDNFATISNNTGLKPFIINGKTIKSMNQYYNKKKAFLQSNLKLKHNRDWSNKLQKLTDKRNNKINYFLHCSSKYIIDWCIKNDINTIVIGRNKQWKQNSNLSERINQNFVQIPHNIFIQKLKYKAENIGINFIETEESYTSGTSFLDNELPIKKNYNKERRIHRGLFVSNTGIHINADLNGSYQIIKKVFPEAFVEGIKGVGLHPIRVNL